MRLFGKTLALCLCVALIAGCDNEEPKANLSEFANQFISMRLGGQNEAARTGQSMINQSFQGLMGRSNGLPGGRVKGEDSDSTLYEPWQSCAIITEETNEDGSVTVTYDYGDGCQEGWGDFKYTMFGKYQYTYRNSVDFSGPVQKYLYSFSTLFDHYGGNYGTHDSTKWMTNGSSFYEGESTYDTVNQKFSGWYEDDSDTEYTYGGEDYEYQSNGRSSYDEKGFTVERSEYRYEQGDDYYRSLVLKPVFTSYECGNPTAMRGELQSSIMAWIPVSGIERISYKQEGKEGTFEVNYGDGTCDAIIFVTENGVTVRVDLSEWVQLF